MSAVIKEKQTFQHGFRIGVALLPSLLLVAEIGGKIALGVLMVRAHMLLLLQCKQIT